jgi:V8-like Glu-specific endopeptidase
MSRHRLSRVRASLWLPMLLVAFAAGASRAAAQAPINEAIDNVDAIQAGLSIGALTELPISLTPCQPDQTLAAALRRRSRGVWAGRFKIERPGTGVWALVVRASDGTLREHGVGTGVSGAELDWFTGPIYGERIDVLLRGPGPADATAVCPFIRLIAELQEKPVGKPRGRVGADNRWRLPSTELDKAPNATQLKQWSSAVVHLETLASPTALIPCTGFYITPRIVMTAGHCLEKSGDITRTRLVGAGGEIRGTNLTLFAKMNADFAVVLVNGPAPAQVLSLGTRSANDFVMWQTPRFSDRLVSVEGCVFDRPDGVLIQHKCDTSDGSSGSPLQLRGGGAVVGIQVVGCLAADLKPTCVNHALGVDEIRKNLKRIEAALRSINSAAATELFNAIPAAP